MELILRRIKNQIGYRHPVVGVQVPLRFQQLTQLKEGAGEERRLLLPCLLLDHPPRMPARVGVPQARGGDARALWWGRQANEARAVTSLLQG